MEAAVKALKMGKSASVDNIPAELVQAGEAMIDILTAIYKIWKTGEWPTTWTQSLVTTLPKKGNLQLPELQNHQPYQPSLYGHVEDHPRLPRVQSCSMAALENGSELQKEFDKGVYSH